jgi:hypothetical protein
MMITGDIKAQLAFPERPNFLMNYFYPQSGDRHWGLAKHEVLPWTNLVR